MNIRKKLIRRILSKAPNSKLNYYFFTLLGNQSGEMERSCFSSWVGYKDGDTRIELREACFIKAEAAIKHIRGDGLPCSVVDSLDEFVVYFSMGGHGLIASVIAKQVVPFWLRAYACTRAGRLGFSSVEKLDPSAFKRATPPKLRMKVFKRDSNRCRICGCNPESNVHVELHVHHIRPREIGGLNTLNNLITLCHTCHKGLEPHYDEDLFSFLEGPEEENSLNKKHLNGVLLYQKNFRVGPT